MKILFICFFALLCTSCVTSDSYNIREINGKDFSCISPKHEMIMYMSYNVCPIFSNKPIEKSNKWTVVNFNDRYTKNDIMIHRKVRDEKNCSGEGKTIQMFLLDIKDKLHVDRISRRSDSIRGDRLFMSGTLIRNNGEKLQWLHEVRGNRVTDLTKRILIDFRICAKI